MAQDVVWTQKWDQVCDHRDPPFTRWFTGGRLSLCYNAVDRHVDEGRGSSKAIVWDSPITNQKSSLTYSELQDKVRSLNTYAKFMQLVVIKWRVSFTYLRPLFAE